MGRYSSNCQDYGTQKSSFQQDFLKVSQDQFGRKRPHSDLSSLAVGQSSEEAMAIPSSASSVHRLALHSTSAAQSFCLHDARVPGRRAACKRRERERLGRGGCEVVFVNFFDLGTPLESIALWILQVVCPVRLLCIQQYYINTISLFF